MGYDLYIGGLQALVDTQGLILLTYTREQLDSPAIVKNSYSQEITLPRCEANDAIFGHFSRADRRVAEGWISGAGAAFNPLKRLDFAIYDEQAQIVESGYCKLNSVDGEGYHVSLFGGLGEFLYSISQKSDGSRVTLADLPFRSPRNERIFLDSIPEPTADMVRNCWRVLAGGAFPDEDWETFLNFAPAYNGIPENFEAGKAICTLGQFYGLDAQGGYITDPDADDAVLVDLGTNATEWEAEDLRANLQRPVLMVSAIFEAISWLSGGTFVVDDDVQDLNWYKHGWLTLKQYDRKDGKTFADCAPAMTPAEFVTGIAKTYGLIFRADEASGVITLMERDRYYDTDLPTIDLSARVDRDTIEVAPYPVGAKWYLFQHQTVGAFAADHLARTGKRYGAMWLDTGYDFDNAQTDVLAGVQLKGAADVLETSPWFIDYGIPGSGTAAWSRRCLKFARNGAAKYTLYQQQLGGALIPKTFDVGFEFYDYDSYGTDDYTDWMPKVQLHEEGNKAADGSGVLLYFNGMTTIPESVSQGRTHAFRLSDESEEMMQLTGGKPCWDLRETSSPLLSLPSFRRIYLFQGDIAESMDFAESQFVGVPDEDMSGTRFVYHSRWETYMADRLDASGRVMTASVNLDGLRVGADLLRRFYWYDGSLWVLNKITNYSLTTSGKTRCEFVKVFRTYAYENSQF